MSEGKRGRPKLDDSLRLTEKLSISFSKKELMRLRIAAAKDNRDARSWMKECVMQAVDVALARPEKDDKG